MHRFQPGNENPILNDKLLREAYEEGRRSALDEQMGGGGDMGGGDDMRNMNKLMAKGAMSDFSSIGMGRRSERSRRRRRRRGSMMREKISENIAPIQSDRFGNPIDKFPSTPIPGVRPMGPDRGPGRYVPGGSLGGGVTPIGGGYYVDPDGVIYYWDGIRYYRVKGFENGQPVFRPRPYGG